MKDLLRSSSATASDSVTTDRALASRLAQFSLLCGNLVWILAGTGATAIALSLAPVAALSSTFKAFWLAFIFAMLAIRFYCLFHWRSHPATQSNVEFRLNLATLLTFMTACAFGLFGYLAIDPSNQLVSLLIIMALTGMVATATAAVAFLLPMYILFILPVMLPVSFRLYSFGEAYAFWIAGLILLYLAVNIGVSRSIRASVLRSIELRFENMDLLEDLKHQHHRAEASLAREEKANLAKSKFLAAASHDLRQPLHSLRLFTATLEMRTRNSQHKVLVNQIDSSVKSLEELFDALLDISKLDAGTIDVNRQHVDLKPLLQSLDEEFRPLALQKGLTFNIKHQHHAIHTDTILLERLIRNLLNNAIRYTESGHVHVSMEERADRLWISVTDSGIGIPDDDRLRIFDEFVQLGNDERDRNQGIGLGLSIVRRIADLLDIELKVQSASGGGSTFLLGVPVGDVAQCITSSSPEPQMVDHVSSLFVLVIDDEEDACLALEGLLETWGCVVMCAQSGAEAVQQLDEIGDVPDLIISDYRLRDGETGGSVIDQVRQHLDIDLPAIVLTGDIAPERLKDIQALGFPLLHKPCEPDLLRQEIAIQTTPANLILQTG